MEKYQIWRKVASAHIIMKGHRAPIVNERSAHVIAELGAAPSDAGEKAKYDARAAQSGHKYDESNAFVYAFLCTAVVGEQLMTVVLGDTVPEADGRKAWKELETKNKGSSVEDIIRCCKQLFNIPNMENQSAQMIATQIKKVCAALKSSTDNIDIHDKLKTALMISACEKNHEMRMMIKMLYATKTDLKFSETVEALVKDEDRSNAQANNDLEQQQKQLVANKALIPKPQPGVKPGDKKCTHCGNTRHDADGCWKLHPEKAPEWYKKIMQQKAEKQAKQQAKKAMEESDNASQASTSQMGSVVAFRATVRNDEEMETAKQAIAGIPGEISWCFDSGTSAHQTPDIKDISAPTIYAKAKICNTAKQGEDMSIIAEGEMKQVMMLETGARAECKLERVRVTPELSDRLMSAALIADRNTVT